MLDEPTNHLDIPSKEMLEEAIRAFEGAVIAVSHDRYFLKQIATRVLLVRGGGKGGGGWEGGRREEGGVWVSFHFEGHWKREGGRRIGN